MSRSNHARKPKNLKNRKNKWYDRGGWILESSKHKRVRLNREVDKLKKDPDYEVQLTTKCQKNRYDYP